MGTQNEWKYIMAKTITMQGKYMGNPQHYALFVIWDIENRYKLAK